MACLRGRPVDRSNAFSPSNDTRLNTSPPPQGVVGQNRGAFNDSPSCSSSARQIPPRKPAFQPIQHQSNNTHGTMAPFAALFDIQPAFPFNDRIGLLLLALSTPHLLYLFTWTSAGAFTRVAKTLGVQAFDLFYNLSVLLKFVQLGALIAFGMTELTFVKAGSVSPEQWVLGALLFGAGQILNMSVYKALGKEGVYYGVRLGRPIAWYEGFPFTVVPHPQYVGCILCIWGVAAVLYSQAAVAAGLLTVSCVWTGYYIFTGVIEHFF